ALSHFAFVAAANPGEVLSDPRLDCARGVSRVISCGLGVAVPERTRRKLALARDVRVVLCARLGGDGNDRGAPVLRFPVEFARQFATTLVPVDSNRVLDGRVWSVVSRGVVFGVAAACTEWRSQATIHAAHLVEGTR